MRAESGNLCYSNEYCMPAEVKFGSVSHWSMWAWGDKKKKIATAVTLFVVSQGIDQDSIDEGIWRISCR